jgi:hypothetical protein
VVDCAVFGADAQEPILVNKVKEKYSLVLKAEEGRFIPINDKDEKRQSGAEREGYEDPFVHLPRKDDLVGISCDNKGAPVIRMLQDARID